MKTHNKLYVVAVLVLLVACAPQREVLEKSSHDVEHVTTLVRDSVVIRDSISMMMRDDTVYHTKYQRIYVNRLLRDTAYVERIDSVPYAVEVVEEVNVLTGFQRAQMRGFWIMCVVVVGFVVWKLRV